MKKLFLCSVVLFALVLSACGAENTGADADETLGDETTAAVDETAAKDETTAETTAADASGSTLTVDPPEGWTPVDGSVLPVQYMKNTASFMAKTEGFEGTTLDDVVASAKSMLESAFDNVVFGETETVTVGGLEARKLIFTCDVSSLSMKYEYIYIIAGSDVWAVTFADLADTFDANTEDSETILANIRFE